MPSVSVVIPFADSADALERTLTSIAQQTHRPDEILIAEGMTTQLADGVRTVPERALESLVEVAGSEWIQVAPAGAFLFPGKLAHQLKSTAKADVIAAPGFDRAGIIHHAPDRPDPWLCLLRARLGELPGNLFRREAVLETGGFRQDTNRTPGYGVMQRILHNGGAVRTDKKAWVVWDQPRMTERVPEDIAAAYEAAAQLGVLDPARRFGVCTRVLELVPDLDAETIDALVDRIDPDRTWFFQTAPRRYHRLVARTPMTKKSGATLKALRSASQTARFLRKSGHRWLTRRLR